MTEITTLDHVTEYPLCWPPGRPRADQRKASSFKVSEAKALADLYEELRLWQVSHYVLSRQPQYRTKQLDPAAALWFYMSVEGGPIVAARDLRVIASDRFTTTAENIRAIGLTLTALRAVDRYGAYSLEQATEGARLALPKPSAYSGPPWWVVLNVGEAWSIDAIEKVARLTMRAFHPDTGGTDESWAQFQAALAEARRVKGATS